MDILLQTSAIYPFVCFKESIMKVLMNFPLYLIGGIMGMGLL